jgi:8-oxo-dGTP pyrophosphatase MutT (NUDIX family)
VTSSGPAEIIAIDRVEIAVEPWSWEFAVARRKEIDRHFACRQRRQPALWNGRVLLLNRSAIGDGVLAGACFETDYASFIAWRDWGFPDRTVGNVFAAAALRGSDGGYLVGEMASSTAAAGQLYFPCGTPDLDDVAPDGVLDLAGSLSRELLEETGIDIGTLAAEPGWRLVRDRGFFALMKRLMARERADALRSRILRHIGRESEPEFIDIRIVSGPEDFDPAMPRFVTAFLTDCWS